MAKYSTLPILDDASPLYGQQDLNLQISKGFFKDDSVALYGPGGVGKSHIAYYYALRIKVAPEDGQHTFWIQANSVSNIDISCRKIANALGLSITEHTHPKDLREVVKTWLGKKNTGKWFLVVDELEHYAEAAVIAELLPKSVRGQVLYTTRTWSVPHKLVALKHDEVCIEVTPPELQSSLKIFEHHVNKKLINSGQDVTRQLVDQCHTPLIVKRAAEYITSKDISSKQMLDALMDQKFETLDKLHQTNNHFEYLLKPLLEPRESKMLVRLLCLLATFHKDDIDFSLIINFEGEGRVKLREMLARLVGLSFLERNEYEEKYSLHEFIQLGLLHWMKTHPLNEQFRIPQMRERALMTLGDAYKNTKDIEVGGHSESFDLGTLPYMIHFGCFLEWVSSLEQRGHEKEKQEIETFKLEPPAVDAIVIFSRTYISQDRQDDAICVLEFALNHSQPEQAIEIAKDLLQAYISKFSIQQNGRDYLTKARNLLEREPCQSLMQASNKDKKTHLNQWELNLHRVRVYTESKKFAESWKYIEPLQTHRVQVTRKQAIQELHEYSPNDEWKAKELCVRTREEEGKFYFARDQRFFGVRGDWKAALSAFEECRVALEEWFPKNTLWVLRVEGYIVDICTRLATASHLQKAEEIIEARLRILENEHPESNHRKKDQKQKQIFFAQSKLAAVHMESISKVEVAINNLEGILQEAEQLSHSDSMLMLASQLRKAYIKGKRLDKAIQLEKTHPDLQKTKPEVDEGRIIRLRITESLVCFFCLGLLLSTLVVICRR